MSLLVLDASVAAKWFLPAAGETLPDEALHLLRCYTNGQIRFIVPDLFWAEFANILWKAVRQGRCTKTTANAAVAAMRDRNLPTASSRTLLAQALNLATAFDRTVYDCLYVAVAIDSKAEFVTADERLAHALALHLPVRWLGSMKHPIP
jgi:predicted nucleic acid-binding protein